jgi:hypothetical protein
VAQAGRSGLPLAKRDADVRVGLETLKARGVLAQRDDLARVRDLVP